MCDICGNTSRTDICSKCSTSGVGYNPMKNLREEIEKILPVGRVAGGIERDELLSLFRQAIDEIIGEDEEQPNWREAEFNIIGRKNQLRNEQRERRNQLVGKEDK